MGIYKWERYGRRATGMGYWIQLLRRTSLHSYFPPAAEVLLSGSSATAAAVYDGTYYQRRQHEFILQVAWTEREAPLPVAHLLHLGRRPLQEFGLQRVSDALFYGSGEAESCNRTSLVRTLMLSLITHAVPHHSLSHRAVIKLFVPQARLLLHELKSLHV